MKVKWRCQVCHNEFESDEEHLQFELEQHWLTHLEDYIEIIKKYKEYKK